MFTEVFPSTSNSLPAVYVAWGLGDIDKETAERWDSDEYGEIQFDPNFKMASAEAQTTLKQICTDLYDVGQPMVSDGLYEDVMECWINNFESYIEIVNGAAQTAIDE